MELNYHFENTLFSGEISEKNGIYCSYYSNKSIKTLETYKNGKLDGLCQTFDLYGNILSEISYKSGKLHGVTKIYHKPKVEGLVTPRLHKLVNYEENVKIKSEKVYFGDGTLFLTYDHDFGNF